jgi:hypothetical protein
MDEWITGIFRDRGAAERAILDLQRAGFDLDDIGVMMCEDTRVHNFTMETSSKAAEGATVDGLVGGAIGAVVAGLTATGSVAALGSTGSESGVIVAGPMAAALAGLGARALGGGVIGALTGLGVPETTAKEIETRLNDGGIVIAVRAVAGSEEKARAILADEQRPRSEQRARAGRGV